MGRMGQFDDPEAALQQYQIAMQFLNATPGTEVQRAHVTTQTAAFALAQDRGPEVLPNWTSAIDVMTRAENASLLATLLLLKSEALEAGRTMIRHAPSGWTVWGGRDTGLARIWWCSRWWKAARLDSLDNNTGADDKRMLVVLGMAVLGAILGVLTRTKRNGNGADMAQYAAGYGIAFALVGLMIVADPCAVGGLAHVPALLRKPSQSRHSRFPARIPDLSGRHEKGSGHL